MICEFELKTFYLEKSGRRFGKLRTLFEWSEKFENVWSVHCVLLCNDSSKKKSRLTVKPVWFGSSLSCGKTGLTAPFVFTQVHNLSCWTRHQVHNLSCQHEVHNLSYGCFHPALVAERLLMFVFLLQLVDK